METENMREMPAKDTYYHMKSKEMEVVYEAIDNVAKYDSTVLILGESGVGKEGLVKRIHDMSARSHGPLIRINCGAIPDNLMESEMFGYAKGAFTGATSQGKLGLMSLANEGTLFLDEVAELSLTIQVKLLRVLQERHFYPIGGVKPVTVDIRLVAATNRNLQSMVESDRFREDLYYRLNVVPIEVPALRERKEGIPGLITFFLRKLELKYQRNKTITEQALAILLQYDWPGNIRQLENMIERLVVTTRGDTIDVQDVPREIKESIGEKKYIEIPDKLPLKELVAQFESAVIQDALRRNKTLSKTSKELGLDVSTLSRKCKKYQIDI